MRSDPKACLLIGVVFWAYATTDAIACRFVQPAPDVAVKEVAAHGVLISGTLIQAFDAARKRPEIIRADEIFVGDGKPRDFVIARSAIGYEQALNPPPAGHCYDPGTRYPVGHKFVRLVLLPASKFKDDIDAPERWNFFLGMGAYVVAGGLDKLLREAAQVGRLQKLPPPAHPCFGASCNSDSDFGP